MKVVIDDVVIELCRGRGQRTGMIWGQVGIADFPSRRIVDSLSRKYLGGKLEAWSMPLGGPTIDRPSVYVQIAPGTSREQRAAFLAALAVRCIQK